MISSMQRRLGCMNENVSKFIEWCIWFSCVIVFSAPLVGTLFEFIDVKWGWVSFVLVVIISAIIASIMCSKKVFYIESWGELLFLGVLLLAMTVIYGQYSPVLEMRQDPSVYMMKALNLVNYGHTYAPAETIQELINQGILSSEKITGYAAMQNGTEYLNGKWFTDFYPGGAFFYAMIGQVSKRFIFYAPSLIMLGNGVLMYFIVKRICGNQGIVSRVCLVLAFYAAPIIVWFGRGTYSEPVALFLTLLLLNSLLADKSPIVLLSVMFLAAYTSRIDYLLILLLGVFIITYTNSLAGGVYTIAAIAEVLVFKNVYWIYYERITNADMPLLKYGIILLILAYLISLLFSTRGRKILHNIYYSKAVKIIVIVVGVFFTLFMFRDNIVSSDEYQMSIIHGRNMMTYVEHIWDLLFLVFPSIILVIGVLCIYQFIHNKEISFLASVFMLGSMGVYLYFFLTSGNSPQLYWMLRRYYNIILPMAFLSFVIFVDGTSKKIGIVISGACLMLSCNLFFNSNQIPDYRGMDSSVVAAAQDLEQQNVKRVFYDEEIRYEISSLLSYSDAEFIPITEQDKQKFLLWAEEEDLKDAVWISSKDYGTENTSYKIEFTKMGESYGEVPQETYEKEYLVYVYPMEQFVHIKELTKNVVYPNIRVSGVQGFYEDGQWTGANMKVETSDMNTSDYDELVIDLYDYNHYWLDNNKLDEQNIRLTINDEIVLEPKEYKDHKVSFDISDINIEIFEIDISSNTINLDEMGEGIDTRDLGLAVKKIYMN